jgi:hypothetical protein
MDGFGIGLGNSFLQPFEQSQSIPAVGHAVDRASTSSQSLDEMIWDDPVFSFPSMLEEHLPLVHVDFEMGPSRKRTKADIPS